MIARRPGQGAGAARHRDPGLCAGPGRDRLRRRPGPRPGRPARPGQGRAHAGRRCRPKPTPAAVADVPRGYLRLYCQAGTRYRVPWPVLAAIGKVESDHGRVRLPGVRSGSNWAGACGPMQIGCVPDSKAGNAWARYGHGRPHDPAAAIPAAARYLVDHGARHNLDRALFAYNHSGAYVAQVKQLARRYAGSRGGAAELRLAQVASGLLAEAHRLTGRLPLDCRSRSAGSGTGSSRRQAEASQLPRLTPPRQRRPGPAPTAATAAASLCTWTGPGLDRAGVRGRRATAAPSWPAAPASPGRADRRPDPLPELRHPDRPAAARHDQPGHRPRAGRSRHAARGRRRRSAHPLRLLPHGRR